VHAEGAIVTGSSKGDVETSRWSSRSAASVFLWATSVGSETNEQREAFRLSFVQSTYPPGDAARAIMRV